MTIQFHHWMPAARNSRVVNKRHGIYGCYMQMPTHMEER